MLPESHNRAYQEFSILLQKLKIDCSYLNQNDHKTFIDRQFQQLQASFQQDIFPLTNAELERAIAMRWQSIQTEIEREFRLLSTDVLFLKSARQPSTINTRLRSVKERIAKLISYCQIMLNERQEESDRDDENIVS